jgi:hypothetical protein
MGNSHSHHNKSHSGTRIEQSLLESEMSYRRLFETAQDGILILDAETGRVNDANPFLIKLLGFSHGQMIGKTVGELSPFKTLYPIKPCWSCCKSTDIYGMKICHWKHLMAARLPSSSSATSIRSVS